MISECSPSTPCFPVFPYVGGLPWNVLPSQRIKTLIDDRRVLSQSDIANSQIQPASLDLRIGAKIWRVQAGFLPGASRTVLDAIKRVAMHESDMDDGAVLIPGCVYVVKLEERLHLPEWIKGVANPKSSTGRLDVFVRLLTDYATEFDSIPAGYTGPVYAEISTGTFSVKIRRHTCLLQMRFLEKAKGMLSVPVDNSNTLSISVDLSGMNDGGIVGYRARKNAPLIDYENVNFYDHKDFWEPVYPKNRSIILDPGAFYILKSREFIAVPIVAAAEMVPFDAPTGEMRVHYAGFFDPGFGIFGAGERGSAAVLEVRARDLPFLLDDGQIVGRMISHPLTDIPDRVYGRDIGSSYQGQGLKLAKQFKKH